MSKQKKRNLKQKKNAYALVNDVIIIAVGIAIALALAKTGLLSLIINSFNDYYVIASFIAGIFFTSVFTLAPSSIAFIHIAENSPIHVVALWGGLGAMCGDLILLFFIRDRFADDLMSVLKPRTVKLIFRSLHFGFMKWLAPLLGAIIIASPLPDEFGITLLGMSKIKLSIFMPLAFVMNTIGIYLLLGFSNLFF